MNLENQNDSAAQNSDVPNAAPAVRVAWYTIVMCVVASLYSAMLSGLFVNQETQSHAIIVSLIRLTLCVVVPLGIGFGLSRFGARSSAVFNGSATAGMALMLALGIGFDVVVIRQRDHAAHERETINAAAEFGRRTSDRTRTSALPTSATLDGVELDFEKFAKTMETGGNPAELAVAKTLREEAARNFEVQRRMLEASQKVIQARVKLNRSSDDEQLRRDLADRMRESVKLIKEHQGRSAEFQTRIRDAIEHAPGTDRERNAIGKAFGKSFEKAIGRVTEVDAATVNVYLASIEREEFLLSYQGRWTVSADGRLYTFKKGVPAEVIEQFNALSARIRDAGAKLEAVSISSKKEMDATRPTSGK